MNRFARILMEEADGGGAGGTKPPTPPTTTPPPATAPATPAPGEEYKSMTPEQFNARLSKAAEGGTKALVKELGFEKVDDIKALLTSAKAEAEAKKTEAQKQAEKIAALEPAAKKVGELEAAVQQYLTAEEAAIPAEKKALLDLAPTEPHAKLAWIAKAKAQGLFTVVAPAAPAVPAVAPLANTRAGVGTPPPPAPPVGQKHPRDMTDAEYRQYEAQWKANKGAAPRG